MQRYLGKDVELVFSDAPTDAELKQVESWAEKMQELSGTHKVIFVHLSPGGSPQLEELMQHLRTKDEGNRRCPAQQRPRGRLTVDEFHSDNLAVPQKRKGINKGKGQRKANRGSRWS